MSKLLGPALGPEDEAVEGTVGKLLGPALGPEDEAVEDIVGKLLLTALLPTRISSSLAGFPMGPPTDFPLCRTLSSIMIIILWGGVRGRGRRGREGKEG